jgi:acetylornithine deacetylase/succinyl-diaminopimelate desuccinylase-like protein
MRLKENEFREAVETLQGLLRIDTTNPPGNERAAANYVAAVLAEDGIESRIMESAPGRANLVARLGGTGVERPLLLTSHLDVVPAVGAGGTHGPFAGVEADGCVWGRGAIDMKGMTAMGIAVMRHLKRRGVVLKRDVVLAAVADEEAGCDFGSGYLVKEHGDLIDAEYVVNEVGGFTMEIAGKRFYPVQVAEKGVAWLRVRARGEAGHSSLPAPDSCLGRLGEAMHRLATTRLPVHVTEPTKAFIRGVSDHMPAPARWVMRGLLKPGKVGAALDGLMKDRQQRAVLHATLSNTANPTMVRGGTKINVIPGEAMFDVDGRLLPGQTAADLAAEVEAVIGKGFEIEVVRESPGTVFSWETPFFEKIREVIRARDPEGIVVPYMAPGFTDSSQYGKTGAICYGFYPLQLPPGLVFSKLFHGVDERIPVESYRFGIETLFDLVAGMAGEEK